MDTYLAVASKREGHASYVARIATTGSIRAARSAGIQHAAIPIAASDALGPSSLGPVSLPTTAESPIMSN